MSICDLEIESVSGGCIMTVEVVYNCEPASYGAVDSLSYRTPGRIDLEEVNVLAVTGYDRDGNVAYEVDHLQLSKARLAWLDDVAWGIIENEICDGEQIYNDLWESA